MGGVEEPESKVEQVFPPPMTPYEKREMWLNIVGDITWMLRKNAKHKADLEQQLEDALKEVEAANRAAGFS